jgi:hypothetical protein
MECPHGYYKEQAFKFPYLKVYINRQGSFTPPGVSATIYVLGTGLSVVPRRDEIKERTFGQARSMARDSGEHAGEEQA